MKRSIMLVLAVAAAAATFPAVADEPAAPARGMRGRRGPGPRLYDPKTVATLTGDVVVVQRMEGRRGAGIHLEVKTAGETVPVHVGPAWFLEQKKLRFAQGDRVEVTGSRVTVDGKAAVIAQVVKKGDSALALRDTNGIPGWAGHGKR